MPESEPLKITDRRAAQRALRSGIVVARGTTDVQRALTAGRQGPAPTSQDDLHDMRRSRMTVNGVGGRRTAAFGSDVSFATDRPRDPTFYWRQNNLPFDTSKKEELDRLRNLCRAIYLSHPLLASAIDIFAKWPVTGMEFTCKDEALTEFYTTLFFDQLDYEEYVTDIGREYWTVGEAWPLGSFNEDLGVWEDDELIRPEDVFVEKSPFLKEPRFYMRLPESLRTVLKTGQPALEYQALMRSYPELKFFTGDDAKMPVSNVLLKQLKFKADTFNPRGVPILMRAIRAVVQEEMLNAAQDAIADRLYTPLILARLGASASDLSTQQPWIPTPDQISSFEDSLDTALAADFRVLTTHFGVQMDSVFGRESMPNLDADFERLAEKQLQVFGLSKTMLSGAGSGETYAADALNRDLISQLLSTYQRYIRRFVRDRMLVVAEAQEHYDYETRSGRRYPVLEEVLVVDEESGQRKIVEQPKLLVPDLVLATMNMQDEEAERQFLEALRASGVPISIKTRMLNLPVNLDEEIERSREEQVELAVEAQKTRKATYQRLRAEGLPIPADLQADFEPKAQKPEGQDDPQQSAMPTRVPQIGVDDADHSALAPSPLDLAVPPGQPDQLPQGPAGDVALPPGAAGGASVIPLPVNRSRPPESDEMRAGMPRPAARVAIVVNGEAREFESALIGGPTSVGYRRQGLKADVPLEEQVN